KESSDLIKESKKKKEKLSTNIIPKESNLTEDRTKVATNVMLISQKHHCNEHERPCYINGSNHLQLTPQ
ncbi:10462_t:CDS:1, partial [Funneliformis geosporum]